MLTRGSVDARPARIHAAPTLARVYADWLRVNQPTLESRAAVVLGLFEALAKRADGPAPPPLRLHALAEPAKEWVLGALPAALLPTALLPTERAQNVEDESIDGRLASAQVLGETLDLLYGVESLGRRSGQASLRRSSGSYFTPRAVARSLVDESLATAHLSQARRLGRVSVCDPAMGGGAFLLEAAAGLSRLTVAEGRGVEDALQEVGRFVFGYDQDPLAVATAEAALFLLTGRTDWAERLICADSLALGSGEIERGFDWLIGNPPWVAFQGRAAQKLPPERRAWLRRTYPSFAGYPTLHGVFAERSTQLARSGLVSLLLPSSVSDLDGYRAARAAVLSTHCPHEPLLEYGQDAFSGVVQPCFGLIASPRDGPSDPQPTRAWQLRERSRHGAAVAVALPPRALLDLAELSKLPAACFGELGLQSNRRVSSELFLRAKEPRAPFVVPILEGRNVRAFAVDAPALFMNPDPVVLAESRCRFRPRSDYERVSFVVRQTAAITIAARHPGYCFRNSLLAGYAREDFDVELLLGLLNSTLLRAFHASQQRDARQATFPQVKVAHLRRLPAPPASTDARARVREASTRLERQGPSAEGFRVLDAAVFDLYGLSASGRAEVEAFMAQRFGRRESA